MSKSFVGYIVTNLRTIVSRQRANSAYSRSPSASFSSGLSRTNQRIPLRRDSTSSERTSSVAVELTALCLVIFFNYYIAHVETTPCTGRARFMDISLDHETKIIKEARRDAQQEFKGKLLPVDHVLSIHIHRIVDKLLRSNNLGRLGTPTELNTPQPVKFASPTTEKQQHDAVPNDASWSLFIVNDDRIVRARADYGTIVVSTGLIPIAKDEHGLAAVISHELGHVVARHKQERISAVKPISVVESVLSKFCHANFSPSQYLSRFPQTSLSQVQEIEADFIGLKIMARAGYDPRAALFVLVRMGEFEEARTILGKHNQISTHPTFPERLQAMFHYLSETYTRYQLAAFYMKQNDSSNVVATLALPLQSQ